MLLWLLWLYSCMQGSMHHLTRHIPYNHHPYSLHPPQILSIFHTIPHGTYLTLSILIQSPYSALLNKPCCGDVGGVPSQAEKSSTALAPGLSQRLSQTCDPHLKAMDCSPDRSLSRTLFWARQIYSTWRNHRRVLESPSWAQVCLYICIFSS